jgi:hypothetical protein
MMTGTPSLPQSGVFAVTGPVWRGQAETKHAAAVACLTGGPVYQVRLRTVDVSPTGIDLPVIDRMCVSASEP